MKVVAFGFILLVKSEYSTLNAFVQEPVILLVSLVSYHRKSSQPQNRSFILCFH